MTFLPTSAAQRQMLLQRSARTPTGIGSAGGYRPGQPVTTPIPANVETGYWRPGQLRTDPPQAIETSGIKSSRGRGGYVDARAALAATKPVSEFVFRHPADFLGGGYFPGHHEQRKALEQYALAQHQNAYAPQFRAAALGYGGAGGLAGAGSSGASGGLAGQYQSAMDAANAANERRYLEALGGYQNRYERNMNALSGANAQEARDINEAYDKRAAEVRQALVGRGLSNSTVMETMLSGVERERQEALGRLNDRRIQNQVSTDAALSGDQLSFMERRNDVGPDFNQLIGLAQAAGQGGVGVSGGVGYATPGQMGFVNPMGQMVRPMPYQSPGKKPPSQNMINRRAVEEARRNAQKTKASAAFKEAYDYSLKPAAKTGPGVSRKTPFSELYS